MAADVARELLIFGILRRAPLSAYDVGRAVRGHVALYRGLKHGNTYHALTRLAEAKLLVRRDAAAARGPSATKAVYRLSAAGERHFHALLRSVIVDLQSSDTALEIAYVLLGQFPRDEALRLLDERREAIATHERRLKRLLGDVAKRGGAAYIGQSHALHRAQAERKFLHDAMTLLANPRWEPAWVTDDGPISDPDRRL
jgi:DNA-binding PadR family transcriptional regulator